MLKCNVLAIYFFKTHSMSYISSSLLCLFATLQMFHQAKENLLDFVFTIKIFIFMILKLLLKNKN